MGLFSKTEGQKEKEIPVLPVFVGAYPFKGEIIESEIIISSPTGWGFTRINRKISETAKEKGFDAVHNIFYTMSDVGVTAYGDAIKLKK